jgi:hypothetical protein
VEVDRIIQALAGLCIGIMVAAAVRYHSIELRKRFYLEAPCAEIAKTAVNEDDRITMSLLNVL